jgi:hypothetical protein
MQQDSGRYGFTTGDLKIISGGCFLDKCVNLMYYEGGKKMGGMGPCQLRL